MSQAVRLDAVGTHATARITTMIAALSWIAGCTDAAPTTPPPTAATPPAQTAPATPLGEAVRRPIDDAQRLREATEEAARKQRREIDAATGG